MEARARSSRWNVRVASSEDAVVRRAARLENRDYTEFVRSSAVHEAERLLADRDQFVLAPEQWDEFVEHLERPPRVPAGLEDLFSRPSVFR